MEVFERNSYITVVRTGVPTKKLHKLLYYAQAHHVLSFGEPLFAETVSAWDMGPVVAHLWWLEKNEPPPATLHTPTGLGEAGLNTVGYVVSRYGKLSGLELERLTHSESPWIDANAERERSGQRSQRIELAAIATYFVGQAQEEEGELPVDLLAVSALTRDAESRESEPVAEDDTPESLLARLRR